MLDHVRHLVENGFAVHLLKPKSKAPAMGMGWSEQPVLTYEELNASYRPGQNLGVRLGKYSRVAGYYLHVIDLDVRDDSKVDDALAVLSGLFPAYPEFPAVLSGSGGASRHFYILTDTPYTSVKLAHSASFFLDSLGHKHWDWEVELFGTGKQVVLPPSVHPDTGRPYTWLREFDFDSLALGIGPMVLSGMMPSVVEYDDLDEDNDLLQLVGPPRGMTLEEIKDLLDALPLDEWCEDREGWLKAGMAIHHETSASDEGFDLWCEYSQQSTKFSYKDSRRVWKSFRLKANKVTIGSLLKAIKDAGLDVDQCLRKLSRCTSYREGVMVVAQYDLMPTERDLLADELAKLARATGRTHSKTSVLKDIALVRKEQELKDNEKVCRSVEQWLAQETLRHHFGGGKGLLSFQGRFWVYHNGVWKLAEENVVASKVSHIAQQALGAGDEIAEPVRIAIRESKRSDSLNGLVGAITGLLLKDQVADRDDPMGLCRLNVPSVVNCLNGELWFNRGEFEFKRHNPKNYFTLQVQTEYQNDAECPLWDRTLAEIFSHYPDADDVIRHLYELMGYMIQPTREHAAWVLFHGKGANGKSLVAGALQALVGPVGSTSRGLGTMGDKSSNNHAEAGLVGKLLLVDDDFRKGAMLPDDQLKRLSEAKMITANPKGSAEFNFICRTTPVILSNHWPRTSDGSYGLERRAHIFHFNRVFSEQEKDVTLLRRIVESELPGLLNHCIAGWRRLMARGRFVEPHSCRKYKEVWLANRNVPSTFISEHIAMDAHHRESGLRLWEAFTAWSQESNSGVKMGRNSFYESVDELPGVTKTKLHNTIYFTGLRLVDVDKFGLLADLLDDDEDLDELI